MENQILPHTNEEVLTEAEVASRLRIRRETLSRWRKKEGLPFIPLSGGPAPRVRYIWQDVLAWLRAKSMNQSMNQSMNLAPAPIEKKRGRPKNVDRALRNRNDGRSS